MSWRGLIAVCALSGALVASGWLIWQRFAPPRQAPGSSGLIIEKRPADSASRTFDPANPPTDMPPFEPGEEAVCDSNFGVSARVAGNAEQTDATDAIVTVTRVIVTLRLQVTTWVPNSASQHVVEHEEGHRQLSERYYQTADQVVRQIATPYLGKQVLISGSDLNAELSKALQKMGDEINQEYYKELNPEPVQLRYDAITDHSRNAMPAKEALEQALAEASVASAQPAPTPVN